MLRRNRYDGDQLHDESPTSPFWFDGGVNWAGFGALLLGTGIAALCLNTSLYVGPVARHLDGADLSSIMGPLVAVVVYVVLVRMRYPSHAQRYPR